MQASDREWLHKRGADIAARAGVSFGGLEERGRVVHLLFHYREKTHRFAVLWEWIEDRSEAWSKPLIAHLRGWRLRQEGSSPS